MNSTSETPTQPPANPDAANDAGDGKIQILVLHRADDWPGSAMAKMYPPQNAIGSSMMTQLLKLALELARIPVLRIGFGGYFNNCVFHVIVKDSDRASALSAIKSAFESIERLDTASIYWHDAREDCFRAVQLGYKAAPDGSMKLADVHDLMDAFNEELRAANAAMQSQVESARKFLELVKQTFNPPSHPSAPGDNPT